MQHYYNPTRQIMEDDLNFVYKWKTTSIIFLMEEEDPDILVNERRPQ
jgi:hypothetical protein